MHVLERHILFLSIFTNPSCRLRRKAEQRADRRARVTARAQFHDLPEQHQRDDRGCRLEIDTDRAAVTSK